LFNTNMRKSFAAAAALGAMLLGGALQSAMAQGAAPAAASKKNYKEGEYPLFDAVLKDIQPPNATKMLADLDAWKQKFPESDFHNERTVLYVQAYSMNKEYAKAVDVAGPLLAGDIDAAFPEPDSGPGWVVRALNFVFTDMLQIPNPTPEEIATLKKASDLIAGYNRQPAGIDAAAWKQAITALQAAAKNAELNVAVAPALAALQKGDCENAQTLFSKALMIYPQNTFISYQLGQAYMCTVRRTPAKNDEVRPKAIYEFIRTLDIDPTVAGTQDPVKLKPILEGMYVNYHGGSDGLDELKAQAKANPLPPDNFKIENATAVSAKKQAQFESQYPQLAMWLKIKGALAAADGQSYFDNQLKNAAVPKLKGTVVEGKPACRSKELIVAVPEPNQPNAQSVITLKLDAPLTGKPEAGEIEWQGVPSAFTPDPFMLTMDTEKAKIEGLKTTPCAGAPARPGVKKSAPKKK
jgi:tetratricopeptide (TPR) repeat protein